MQVEIFCCYARKDQALLHMLKAHLIPLQRQGFISIWADTDISAGTPWKNEIEKHLDKARIVLLLISQYFIASEYCYSVELKQSIEQHKQRKTCVIPIIMRPCSWEFPPLNELQAIPKNAKPVTMWKNRDAAFLDIAQGISNVVDQLRKNQIPDLTSHKQTYDNASKNMNTHQIRQEFSTQVDEIRPPIPEPNPKQSNIYQLRPGRILVVDDIEQWRKELVELLQRNGYYADSASSATEALERLDEALYHLVITDIRQSESDVENQGGLVLLRGLDKRGLSQEIKAIINSASFTKDNLRKAFEVYKVIDFLSKDDFDSQIFLDVVQRTFLQKMKINLALEIHWQGTSKSKQSVLNLEVDAARVEQGTVFQIQMAAELEDLLCRLFYKAKSVLVQSVMQDRSAVLRVRPFYTRGSGHEVIVKFGDFHKIEDEYQNFQEYVQPFLGGAGSTIALDFRCTPHLGGIIYSILGTSNDQLLDFSDFYRCTHVSQIIKTLERFFLDTCGMWYANRGHLYPHNLTADYQRLLEYTPEMLEQISIRKLKSVRGVKRLSFNSLKGERTFTNPLLALAGPPLVRSTYSCITNGNFNQHNLLVDSKGNLWMIDFEGMGQSHILRDVAMLDSMVRFQLLSEMEATLEERLQMEEVLCSIERFSQVGSLKSALPTPNLSLAKCYEIVVYLRTLAGMLVETNPSDDINEYYIALLYSAVNTLQFFSLPLVQREHALLCASLLVDKLGLSSHE